MFNTLAWNAGRVIAQKGGPVSRGLYSLASIYVRCYNNLNYDMATNGEHVLLDRLAAVPIKTVFDVGGNRGDYSQACLSRFPEASVHAFEIVPATFRKLQANVNSPRAHLNSFGLSNAAGKITVNYNPEHDGASSIIEGGAIHTASWERLDVEVRTGDDYCAQAAIETIDLLKIDVEGAEHLVLEGFGTMLEQGRIAMIQFEFGMVNIYSKFLLVDFWALLTRHGFVLGPIMPTGVAFKDYDPREEDFQGPPNFFAVHTSRPDLIQAARRPK